MAIETKPTDAISPKTLSVPQAGREYFGIGKDAAYRAARDGDFPVLKIGGTLRVPVAALEKMLADATTIPRQKITA